MKETNERQQENKKLKLRLRGKSMFKKQIFLKIRISRKINELYNLARKKDDYYSFKEQHRNRIPTVM